MSTGFLSNAPWCDCGRRLPAERAAAAYENILLTTHEEDAEFALSVARIGLAYRDIGSGDLEISRSFGDLPGLPHGTHTIPRAEFPARMHRNGAHRRRRTGGTPAASVIREHAGYTVVGAANAAGAEERSGTLERLDLLLADVIMPGGNGPDLFRRLGESRPASRSCACRATRRRTCSTGLTSSGTFLAKPFSAASLAAKVRQILDQ